MREATHKQGFWQRWAGLSLLQSCVLLTPDTPTMHRKLQAGTQACGLLSACRTACHGGILGLARCLNELVVKDVMHRPDPESDGNSLPSASHLSERGCTITPRDHERVA